MMHNLDKILEKILSQAQMDADRILESARQECDAIQRESEAREQSILEAARARAEREKEVAAQRAASTADMKQREILLAAKVGMLSRAFVEAENYLYALSKEDYCVFLAHLLADAAAKQVQTAQRLGEMYGEKEAADTDFQLLLNEKDQELGPLIIKAAKTFLRRMSPQLEKTKITLAQETVSIRGGLILRYGDIESNCSVETVVRGMRECMEETVINILFVPQYSKESK